MSFTDSTILITAFSMGLAGSLHCLTMCSPLVMASTARKPPSSRVVYNLGRILSYAVLGTGVATFGSLFQLAGFQDVLSVGLGMLLIVLGIAGMTSLTIPVITPVLLWISNRLKIAFSFFLSQKSPLSIFVLGMLNGLLPCGLTYLALAYCVTVDSPATGFVFMIAFGLGTLPVMLGLTSTLHLALGKFDLNPRKLTTIAMIALGTLILFRGFMVHPVSRHADQITICK